MLSIHLINSFININSCIKYLKIISFSLSLSPLSLYLSFSLSELQRNGNVECTEIIANHSRIILEVANSLSYLQFTKLLHREFSCYCSIIYCLLLFLSNRNRTKQWIRHIIISSSTNRIHKNFSCFYQTNYHRHIKIMIICHSEQCTFSYPLLFSRSKKHFMTDCGDYKKDQ